jgi:hypothetical protein
MSGSRGPHASMCLQLFRESMAATIRGTVESEGGSSSTKKKRKRAQHPLEQFAMIVPPLTMSFIESFKAGRDQLDKAHRGKEAWFADDGFSIGVAFVLAVLNQERAFDALHWFDAIVDHCK